jgi:uncharacterized membrane protein YGL010W
MRTLDQFLTEYGMTHRNPTNQLIHFICVPVIFISTLALGWLVNAGLLGVEGAAARWVNLSTVAGGLILLFFYSRLGLRASLSMIAWFAISVGLILAVQASPLPLWAVATVVWVAAWAVQLVGHNIEGAKPSFFDDLVFLLIGPLFVLDELGLRMVPRKHG